MNSKNNQQTLVIPSNFNLGYACINMTLRKQKKQQPVFMSRTLRLKTLQEKGFHYLKSLAIQNCQDILTILKWNKEHDISFMRLSSDIFPFASHPEHGYSIEFARDYLKEAGDYAKEHCIRLSQHPGQFNVLSSPNEKVITNTILDLTHHCDILDMMGTGPDSVIIIHGGGVYDDKKKSLQRFVENFKILPKRVQDRIVIENCEMAYTIEDLLPISEMLSVPLVCDFHHNDINSSSKPIEEYFDRVFKVWQDRNIKPKVHVSNSVPGITKDDSKTARRKHSDYIYYIHPKLYKIKFPLDVMLECKMKELAILQLQKTA